jgi:AraC-like DNA-binding protein
MARTSRAPIIRANILAAVVAELVRRGLSPERLLREHIDSGGIGSLYDEIPLARYVAFFEAAATLAGDSTLGVQLGMHMHPEEMGPLGVIFMAAPDVRTALNRLGFFLRAWQGGTAVELETQATTAEWSYQIEEATIWPRRQDAEFSIATTCSLIRGMLGRSWNPLEIHFEHAAPEGDAGNRARLQRLLGAPVQFDQSVNRLVFERADLGRLVSLREQPIAPYLEEHLRDLMHADMEEAPFSTRVSFLVAKRLGHRALNMSSLAAELGISARTLQRRLSEDGTSLRQIVRVERARVAEALLRAKHTPMIAIAHDLGYADTAVFSRAFKAWRGTSPRNFRRLNSR